MRNWIRQMEVHTHGRENVDAILIANKSDLSSHEVETAEGAALAKEFNMPFFETSAHTGHNVQEAFMHITKAIKDRTAAKEELLQKEPEGRIPEAMRNSVVIRATDGKKTGSNEGGKKKCC